MKKLLEKLESIVELKLTEVKDSKGVYAGSSISYDTSETSDTSNNHDSSVSFDYSQNND